jgi:SARP family transcriptional regulator, regulator of embCAB operon
MSPARVQLCGRFVVELDGRRVERRLPRQGRLLLAQLVLERGRPQTRDRLAAALWGERPPASAPDALTALVSKVRTALGAGVLHGRSELELRLPPGTLVDVEQAQTAVHAAESACALGEWPRAWSSSLAAQLVAARPFLVEHDGPDWVDERRRELGELLARALECYTHACLGIGGTELAGAERTARRLVRLEPLRESGHVLLMDALAARGNPAEALAAYERLRVVLREELGVPPSAEAQERHRALLAGRPAPIT